MPSIIVKRLESPPVNWFIGVNLISPRGFSLDRFLTAWLSDTSFVKARFVKASFVKAGFGKAGLVRQVLVRQVW